MTTLRTGRWLLVLLLAACTSASPLAPGMRAVEKIRGLEFRRDVKNVTIDRADLTPHLRAQLTKSLPYSVDDWGMMLRALQLVDVEGPEILPQLLSLYEAQVLAFYDPHSHTYYSIRQLPDLPDGAAKLVDPQLLEETVMVHELTHALQDQHFSLAAKEKLLRRDSDANMAYHAVLEGEALLVMLAHTLGKMGVSLDEALEQDAMAGMLATAAQAEQMIGASTPRYFAEMLKFPYMDGLRFVIEAYRRGGWKELDRVHANPPRTTREILNPTEYFQRTYKPPAFTQATPEGAISAEHLGEFHWRFLVGSENARGLVADRAIVWRDGRVAIETRWESPERAAAFADAYSAFLDTRGIEANVTRDGASVAATYTAK